MCDDVNYIHRHVVTAAVKDFAFSVPLDRPYEGSTASVTMLIDDPANFERTAVSGLVDFTSAGLFVANYAGSLSMDTRPLYTLKVASSACLVSGVCLSDSVTATSRHFGVLAPDMASISVADCAPGGTASGICVGSTFCDARFCRNVTLHTESHLGGAVSHGVDMLALTSINLLPFNFSGTPTKSSARLYSREGQMFKTYSSIKKTINFQGDYKTLDGGVETVVAQGGYKVDQSGTFRFRFFVGISRVPIYRVTCTLDSASATGTFLLTFNGEPTTPIAHNAAPPAILSAGKGIGSIISAAVVFGNYETAACSHNAGASSIIIFLDQVTGVDPLMAAIPAITATKLSGDLTVTTTKLFVDTSDTSTTVVAALTEEKQNFAHRLLVSSWPTQVQAGQEFGRTNISARVTRADVRGLTVKTAELLVILTELCGGTCTEASLAQNTCCGRAGQAHASVWRKQTETQLCGTTDIMMGSSTATTSTSLVGMVGVGQNVRIGVETFMVVTVQATHVVIDRGFAQQSVTGAPLFTSENVAMSNAWEVHAPFDPTVDGWSFDKLQIEDSGADYYSDIYDQPERVVRAKLNGAAYSKGKFNCKVINGDTKVECILDGTTNANDFPPGQMELTTVQELWATRIRFDNEAETYFIGCTTKNINLFCGATIAKCSGLDGAEGKCVSTQMTAFWTLSTPYKGTTKSSHVVVHQVVDWAQRITVSGVGLDGTFQLRLALHNSTQITPSIAFDETQGVFQQKLESMSNVPTVKVFALPPTVNVSAQVDTSTEETFNEWRVVFYGGGQPPLLGKESVALTTLGGGSTFVIADGTQFYDIFPLQHSFISPAMAVIGATTPTVLSVVGAPRLGIAGEYLAPQPLVSITDADGNVLASTEGYVHASLVGSRLVQTIRCFASGGAFILRLEGMSTSSIPFDATLDAFAGEVANIWTFDADALVTRVAKADGLIAVESRSLQLVGVDLWNFAEDAPGGATATKVRSCPVVSVAQSNPAVVTACSVGVVVLLAKATTDPVVVTGVGGMVEVSGSYKIAVYQINAADSKYHVKLLNAATGAAIDSSTFTKYTGGGEIMFGTTRAFISDISRGNPAIITACMVGHPFRKGDLVHISSVGGMSELNHVYVADGVNVNTFQLRGVDASSYAGAGTGGTSKVVDAIKVDGMTDIAGGIAVKAHVLQSVAITSLVVQPVRGYATDVAQLTLPGHPFQVGETVTAAGIHAAVNGNHVVLRTSSNTVDLQGIDAINIADPGAITGTVTSKLRHPFKPGDAVKFTGLSALTAVGGNVLLVTSITTDTSVPSSSTFTLGAETAPAGTFPSGVTATFDDTSLKPDIARVASGRMQTTNPHAIHNGDQVKIEATTGLAQLLSFAGTDIFVATGVLPGAHRGDTIRFGTDCSTSGSVGKVSSASGGLLRLTPFPDLPAQLTNLQLCYKLVGGASAKGPQTQTHICSPTNEAEPVELSMWELHHSLAENRVGKLVADSSGLTGTGGTVQTLSCKAASGNAFILASLGHAQALGSGLITTNVTADDTSLDLERRLSALTSVRSAYVGCIENGVAIISNVTLESPALVKSTTHGFTNGDLVKVVGVQGTREINGNIYVVSGVQANTFALDGVDSRTFTPYEGGGVVLKVKAATTVNAVSKANPAVVQAPGHPFQNGDAVIISRAKGMSEINGVVHTVASVDTGSFALSGVDSQEFAAYTSGAVVEHICKVCGAAGAVVTVLAVEGWPGYGEQSYFPALQVRGYGSGFTTSLATSTTVRLVDTSSFVGEPVFSTGGRVERALVFQIKGITKQTGKLLVATDGDHGLKDNEMVIFSEIRGMTQLHAGFYAVTERTANTFTVAVVSVALYSDYIGGGVVSFYAAARIVHVASGVSAVVQTTGHQFVGGDAITLTGVTGMSELNGRVYEVGPGPTATSFVLKGLDTSANKGYSAYLSGGTATLVTGAEVVAMTASASGIDVTACTRGQPFRDGARVLMPSGKQYTATRTTNFTLRLNGVPAGHAVYSSATTDAVVALSADTTTTVFAVDAATGQLSACTMGHPFRANQVFRFVDPAGDSISAAYQYTRFTIGTTVTAFGFSLAQSALSDAHTGATAGMAVERIIQATVVSVSKSPVEITTGEGLQPFQNGDKVRISGHKGMQELVGKQFVVEGATTSTIRLSDGGVSVAGSAFAAWQSGGVVELAHSVAVATLTQKTANSVEIGATGHPFSDGDMVIINGAVGSLELNDNTYVVGSSAANTFDLANTGSITAYQSGGVVTLAITAGVVSGGAGTLSACVSGHPFRDGARVVMSDSNTYLATRTTNFTFGLSGVSPGSAVVTGAVDNAVTLSSADSVKITHVATRSAPAITACRQGHTFSDNNIVKFRGVGGMVRVNNNGLDASITAGRGLVTVATTKAPTLKGTLAQPIRGGTARFTDLRVDTAGEGYKLELRYSPSKTTPVTLDQTIKCTSLSGSFQLEVDGVASTDINYDDTPSTITAKMKQIGVLAAVAESTARACDNGGRSSLLVAFASSSMTATPKVVSHISQDLQSCPATDLTGVSAMIDSRVVSISAVTSTDPPVVTAASHGFKVGEKVTLFDMAAFATLDQNTFVVSAASFTVNTFALTGAANPSTVYTGGASVALEGISRSSPAVVLATGHPFSNGDKVRISGVEGMAQVNGMVYTVTARTAASFALAGLDTTLSTTPYFRGGHAGTRGTLVATHGLDTLDFTGSSILGSIALAHPGDRIRLSTESAPYWSENLVLDSWVTGGAAPVMKFTTRINRPTHSHVSVFRAASTEANAVVSPLFSRQFDSFNVLKNIPGVLPLPGVFYVQVCADAGAGTTCNVNGTDLAGLGSHLAVGDQVRIHESGSRCRVESISTAAVVGAAQTWSQFAVLRSCLDAASLNIDAGGRVVSRLATRDPSSLNVHTHPSGHALQGGFLATNQSVVLLSSNDVRASLSAGDLVDVAFASEQGGRTSVVAAVSSGSVILADLVPPPRANTTASLWAKAVPAGEPFPVQPIVHLTDVFGNTGADDMLAAEVFVDNATQELVCDATGGSFRLVLEGRMTAKVAWNDAPAVLESALRAISPGAGAIVVVTGPRQQVCTFGGTGTVIVRLAGQRMGPSGTAQTIRGVLQIEDATLSGGVAATVQVVVASGLLKGTRTVPIRNGIAAFTDLSIDSPGRGYKLSFRTFPGGLPLSKPLRTRPFDVVRGRAHHATVVSPLDISKLVSGRDEQLGEPVVVELRDRGGKISNAAADIAVHLLQSKSAVVHGVVLGSTKTVFAAMRHGFEHGDHVVLSGMTGMASLNGVEIAVANPTTDAFEAAGLNTNDLSPYTGGTTGRATRALHRVRSDVVTSLAERAAVSGRITLSDIPHGGSGAGFALEIVASTKLERTASGIPCAGQGGSAKQPCLSPARYDSVLLHGCVGNGRITGIATPACAFRIDSATGEVPVPAYVELGAKHATVVYVSADHPASVRTAGHTFQSGECVRFTGVVGTSQINGRVFEIAEHPGANTFELRDTNSVSWGTYRGGGSVRSVPCTRIRSVTSVTSTELAVTVSNATAFDMFKTGTLVELVGLRGVSGTNGLTLNVKNVGAGGTLVLQGQTFAGVYRGGGLLYRTTRGTATAIADVGGTATDVTARAHPFRVGDTVHLSNQKSVSLTVTQAGTPDSFRVGTGSLAALSIESGWAECFTPGAALCQSDTLVALTDEFTIQGEAVRAAVTTQPGREALMELGGHPAVRRTIRAAITAGHAILNVSSSVAGLLGRGEAIEFGAGKFPALVSLAKLLPQPTQVALHGPVTGLSPSGLSDAPMWRRSTGGLPLPQQPVVTLYDVHGSSTTGDSLTHVTALLNTPPNDQCAQGQLSHTNAVQQVICTAPPSGYTAFTFVDGEYGSAALLASDDHWDAEAKLRNMHAAYQAATVEFAVAAPCQGAVLNSAVLNIAGHDFQEGNYVVLSGMGGDATQAGAFVVGATTAGQITLGDLIRVGPLTVAATADAGVVDVDAVAHGLVVTDRVVVNGIGGTADLIGAVTAATTDSFTMTRDDVALAAPGAYGPGIGRIVRIAKPVMAAEASGGMVALANEASVVDITTASPAVLTVQGNAPFRNRERLSARGLEGAIDVNSKHYITVHAGAAGGSPAVPAPSTESRFYLGTLGIPVEKVKSDGVVVSVAHGLSDGDEIAMLADGEDANAVKIGKVASATTDTFAFNGGWTPSAAELVATLKRCAVVRLVARASAAAYIAAGTLTRVDTSPFQVVTSTHVSVHPTTLRLTDDLVDSGDVIKLSHVAGGCDALSGGGMYVAVRPRAVLDVHLGLGAMSVASITPQGAAGVLITTSEPHGLVDGDFLQLRGVSGLDSSSGGIYAASVAVDATKTFVLRATDVGKTLISATPFAAAAGGEIVPLLGSNASGVFQAGACVGSIGKMARLDGTYVTGVSRAASAATARVQAPGHRFSNGMMVRFSNVGGMGELNSGAYEVAEAVLGTSFVLKGVDSRTLQAYTSGGVVARARTLCTDRGTTAAIVTLEDNTGGAVPKPRPLLRGPHKATYRLHCDADVGSFALSFRGETTVPVFVDDTATVLQSKLAALATTGVVSVVTRPANKVRKATNPIEVNIL